MTVDARVPPTKAVTDETLAEIVRRLSAALNPRAIYLFGSYAYGTPQPESDIDLMVVAADAGELTVDYLKRAHACLRGTFLPVELHFRSESRFHRRSGIGTSLEHDVMLKGRRLYAA
jgi:predicted nucleotidyltransferase